MLLHSLSRPRVPVSNREIGFLRFNERVLELANDPLVPLLERLRFLCISTSNLDEFFEIRVAGLRQRIAGGLESAGVDGLSPQQELAAITRHVTKFVDSQYRTFNNVLLPELSEQGIRFLARSEWDAGISNWVAELFRDEIAPVLSPLGLDPAHPFPELTNKSLTFIIDLEGADAFGRDSGYALVRAPRSLPRVIKVPKAICGHEHGFVFLSSIIHSQMAELFPGLKPVGVYQFKVTRNSDLYVSEEDVANLRRALEAELMQRNFGQAVRLEVVSTCPDKIVKFLMQQFKLDDAAVFKVDGPVNLNRLVSIPDDIDRPDLKYRQFSPYAHPADEAGSDIFTRIRTQGQLIYHHPYESYLPVVELMRQAATDPDVLAIKQTLYRTGSDSVFVDMLMDASRAGKDVTVVIELRARFDEEANIELASRLQRAGIQVVYGVVGFKTHAKMLLVVRREKSRIVHYAHVGTGNYHTTTARIYTDLSMLTNDSVITRDIQKIFGQLTGRGAASNLKKLVQAPFNLHSFLLDKINHEIRNAKAGKEARIIARMNSLVDVTTIDTLYKASKAGVKIELIVRGICTLIPGVKGLSENIRVVSVLGRFLEHSRVFYFASDGQPELYMSSADWMPRNLYSRVEIAVPIAKRHLPRIKKECLDFYLKDNCFCWELQSDGQYRRLGELSKLKSQTKADLKSANKSDSKSDGKPEHKSDRKSERKSELKSHAKSLEKSKKELFSAQQALIDRLSHVYGQGD